MGLDQSAPAFVSWLGFTQEYLLPEEMRDEPGQALGDFFTSHAAASGEPWLTFFTPAGVSEVLAVRGRVVTDDVGRREQIDPSLWERAARRRPHELGRLAHAVVA